MYRRKPQSSATFMVAVLAGGESAEREVSLASGAQVARALAARHHLSEMFDPARTDLFDIPWSRFDGCFIALHGGAGEDGRVQSELERLGVPYTGSGPAASRLAMSKSAAKERFAAAGVPTMPWVSVSPDEPWVTAADRVERLGYPVVVKPDGQGSSLGVGFANIREELPDRLAAARRFDPLVLVEPWIDGREFTVAVLGRDALPLLEIATPRGWFDYQAKYKCDDTEYRFETGLPPQKSAELETLGAAAAEALGTAGLVRVDLMLDRSGQPWVLEVNTVPGLTEHSLAPKAAARAGFDLPALCDWMLRNTLHVELPT